MITGDSKETAVAIAKELEILDPYADTQGKSYSGMEFEKMSEKQKREALSGESGMVFSRVEPKHKRELVKILIENVRLL